MRRFIRAPRLARFVLLMTSMFSTPKALASDLTPAEIRGDQRKNPVSVLQNRYFLKAWRPELGFTAGTFMNEAYTDTTYMGLRGAVFVNEWIGLELQHSSTSIADSEDRKALNQKKYRRIDEDTVVSPDPEVNPIHEVSEANVVFAPFYGKLNLLDTLIVYSDLYVTTGFAKVNTDQGNLNAGIMGVGQRLYWGQSVSMRFDYRNRMYNEKRAGETILKKAHSFDFGMSYFFF